MPTYRLEVLLQLRERAKRTAEEELARALGLLAEAEARLEQEIATLSRMVEDRHRRRAEYARKLASGEMRITEQANAHRFIDRLKEKEAEQQAVIDAQREQVREAEKGVQRARAALVTATQDLKALERHREKWAEEVRRERALREEEALDELGQTIHQQQERGRSPR